MHALILRRRNRPARKAQAGLTLLEIMIVIAILGLLVVIVVPRVMGALSKSQVDLMKIRVNKIADEEFPRWAVQNNDKQCPADLLEIGKAVDANITADAYVDAWGKPFKMSCGDTAPAGAKFGVSSFGEDGKDNTPDDIKSWEKTRR
jgi:general secretion pathway protein G